MEENLEKNPLANIKTTKNPREAAFLAVLASIRKESFVADELQQWFNEMSPDLVDFNLAKEIAYGVTRLALALDYLAEKLASREQLKLKLREKVLLRTSLYQHYYMNRIPLYAIANETIEIAKIYCHPHFTRFLNAILRRASENTVELPQGDTVPEMSTRFSYPAYFVQEIVQNYGLERAKNIMEAGNKSSKVMFRIRPEAKDKFKNGEAFELLAGTLAPIAVVLDNTRLTEIAKSDDYYIQNVTPAELIYTLAKDVKEPKKVLDLCASPGGKLIALHDLFPSAALFANDVSEKKLSILKDNLEKYKISTKLSCISGESYPSEELFDLIVLDVPCSNSGVLNKRPEARWRLSQKEVEQLEQLQMRLLSHAASLLTEEGEIWYMTCSILKRENIHLVENACKKLGLQIRVKERFLPNLDGWDGGFACALTKY